MDLPTPPYHHSHHFYHPISGSPNSTTTATISTVLLGRSPSLPPWPTSLQQISQLPPPHHSHHPYCPLMWISQPLLTTIAAVSTILLVVDLPTPPYHHSRRFYHPISGSPNSTTTATISTILLGGNEPPHQIRSYTLLFSLFLHFPYIADPPLRTSASTRLHDNRTRSLGPISLI